MTHKNVKRSTICLALAFTMTIPHFASAQSLPIKLPIDVGIDDGSKDSDTGLGPTQPNIPKTGTGPTAPSNGGNAATPGTQVPGPTAPKPGGTVAPGTQTPGTVAPGTKPAGVGGTMVPVKMSNSEFSCSILSNPTNADLLKAVDELSKAVTTTASCSGTPSAKGITDNGNKLKDSIAALNTIMQTTDASQVNVGQIETQINAALTAVGNLGDIVNNNTFLNSSCGRQSMTTGKVLLSLNEVISGMAPYALFAVSMNAALAPALPFVIGGTAASLGISALAKMFDKGSLNMADATTRNAVLQNTCQFTKVATKVRFMQLAQSGKIDKITQELERDVDLYKAKFKSPSTDLSKILNYKNRVEKYHTGIEKQLQSDQADYAVVQSQVGQNREDDILMCTLGQELANWAQDGKTFPSSVFNNLSTAVQQANSSQKLQVATLKAVHESTVKRIKQIAPQASSDEAALKNCAQATRSWMSSVGQALTMTSTTLAQNKNALAYELNQYPEYSAWKSQYDVIETQKLTIKRVEKAMLELQKDTSIIDRSELAQRMVTLKSGLFGTRGFGWGNKPRVPVLEWIDHTKEVHDKTISAFLIDFKAVREASFSITETGRGLAKIMMNNGMQYDNPIKRERDLKIADTLGNITVETVPVGTRQHEIICQNLESAWLDWAAALDHLGAIQFFCDMIDPVLDAKMDQAVVEQCRGNTKLSGVQVAKSVVTQAREVLTSRGFQQQASIISAKLKELECPMPAVSVMNE